MRHQSILTKVIQPLFETINISICVGRTLPQSVTRGGMAAIFIPPSPKPKSPSCMLIEKVGFLAMLGLENLRVALGIVQLLCPQRMRLTPLQIPRRNQTKQGSVLKP